MEEMLMKYVIYKTKGRIAYITLNRPEVLNAINADAWQELAKAWENFRDDPEVWTAILTGAGEKAFSVGADLKELNTILGVAAGKEPSRVMRIVTYSPTRNLHVWKPIIAAINGVAMGGGLELAMACDLRIATEQAMLGSPEARVGVIPTMGGTQRLARLIPFSTALKMLMTGELINAKEALRIGLVDEVVPQDKLMSAAEALANKINENSPLAVRSAKEAAYRGIDLPLEEALQLESLVMSRIFFSNDTKEGIQAFLERRAPIFRGE
jgi:enoyl-CoA hydratase/carnithine racemase